MSKIKSIDEKLYGEVISKQEEEDLDENRGSRAGEFYQYFNLNNIMVSMKLTSAMKKRGQEIRKNGQIRLVDVNSGYVNDRFGTKAGMQGRKHKPVF